MRCRPAAALVAAAAFSAAPLIAQAPAVTPTPARADTDHGSVVTFSPLAALYLWFTGDYEHRIAPTATVGLGGTLNANSHEDTYGALEAKYRYYPSAKAPEGFSIAGTLGIARGLSNLLDDSRPEVTRGTIGTELSYQWLLGARRRFVVVIGAGAKRHLGTGDFPSFELVVVPTARVNIGFAF